MRKGKLEPQTFGINMAQAVFGGPRGIWLECRYCPRAARIVGSVPSDSYWASKASDEEVANVFREGGWTGEGLGLKNAKCPQCVAAGRTEYSPTYADKPDVVLDSPSTGKIRVRPQAGGAL